MISQLATELCECQSQNDRFKEAIVLRKIVGRNFHKNATRKSSLISRFYEKIAFGSNDCWCWVGYVDQLGYGRLAHELENKSHRISWLIHKGEIPQGIKVLHRCDLRCCVNPDHLFLGTQTDNMQDMIFKKRGNHKGFPGTSNPMAKLNESKVNEIKSLRDNFGYSFKKIAKIMNVAPMTVHRAYTNKTWRKNENI